jgi:pyruvate/oxaloacetate carboxyltransferase
MPALIDTTVRLLSQEPLAGRVPTASILELAEVLDHAGFAALEVSGGGVLAPDLSAATSSAASS